MGEGDAPNSLLPSVPSLPLGVLFRFPPQKRIQENCFGIGAQSLWLNVSISREILVIHAVFSLSFSPTENLQGGTQNLSFFKVSPSDRFVIHGKKP